jgi:hypothetical protein
MASCGLSPVLALAIQAARRPTEGERGDSDPHPPYGGREFRLGSTEVHRELLTLGFEVSERTVARYLQRLRRRGDPAKRWLAFLANHREVIVAFDFFTVPTLTFQLLYCFLVIEHGRRRVVHFNVTRHPTAEWVVQQQREAFPEAGPYRYAILDHDSKFDADVIAFLQATGLQAEAHECSGAVAKRDCGTLGGKLRPRDSRPCHRAQRTTPAAAHSRLRELPPQRPDSRFPR